MPTAYSEAVSRMFVEHDDNGMIIARNGKPFTDGREHKARMAIPDLLPLFVKTFNERYKNDYYYVRFFEIYEHVYYRDGEPKKDFYFNEYDGETDELTRENIISWKLLLDDALRISAGRQKPLKLAIEIANNLRTACGREYDNVPNVFQNEANADFMSALTPGWCSLVDPTPEPVSVEDIIAAGKKKYGETLGVAYSDLEAAWQTPPPPSAPANVPPQPIRAAMIRKKKEFKETLEEELERMNKPDNVRDEAVVEAINRLHNRLDSPLSVYTVPNPYAPNNANESIDNAPLVNAERDAMIYDLRVQNVPWAEVCNIINEKFDEAMDDKSASAALRRHCDRRGLLFPKGKPGRKSL